MLYKELTSEILKAFYDVYNELGYGFLERVYQNAMFYELKSRGFEVNAQRKITVYYKDLPVGDYFADIIVNNIIILELKACDYLTKDFEHQIVNYLRSTHCEVGLLLNFGKKPEFVRKVFENINK
ncbi:GxxExxY protein [Flavobacterium rivuli WB 3.3-2 = DSM 21788]|uniref:GxxExxY protein n=1 Tax=Flavobacterium rivuli WB 3.3-2 = DSM 21788 TaxID=1121895 RepID=A0A0A2M2K8_9FLAO|nr:GxxExxY protein [Flavobacterium rivuli]KGO86887.1 GxxExxY protein [Flavobacterium rivuli WB 3.3-2 = DSM 21788]